MEDRQNFPHLVRELMAVGVPTCALDTPCTELAQAFLDKGWEAVVVLDENGHGAGAVSRVELARAFALGKDQQATAEQIMSPEIPKVPPDIPLLAAVQLMLDQGVRAVYMVHHAGGIEYPAAWMTFDHILRLIAARAPDELSDLGIKANRKAPLDAFIERRDAARKRNRSLYEE